MRRSLPFLTAQLLAPLAALNAAGESATLAVLLHQPCEAVGVEVRQSNYEVINKEQTT
jgi:hypothetical protein